MPSSSAAAPALAPVPNPDFIVDTIFPTREVHLIGGPSGAGKTRLTLQLLDDWRSGRDVFGHRSHPAPYCYIACDRSTASVERTMRGLAIADVPMLSLVDRSIPRDAESVLQAAIRLVPDLRVLFVDAIAVLTPECKINDYGVVMRFLTDLTRSCQNLNLTILGLGHATKTKEGERYANPRQRFLGSVAWGGYCDTMVFIEPEKADDPSNPNRVVHLLPRNSTGETFDYRFTNSGRLIMGAQADEAAIGFRRMVEAHDIDHVFRSADLLAMAATCDIARRAAYAIFNTWIADGFIEQIRRGTWRRSRIN